MKIFNRKRNTYLCLNMGKGHIKSLNKMETTTDFFKQGGL